MVFTYFSKKGIQVGSCVSVTEKQQRAYMNARKKTAERIKAARSIAGYAERKAFCSRFSFPLATLEAWERGKNPLTLKGAKRLVEILREAGIYSSEEWLR